MKPQKNVLDTVMKSTFLTASFAAVFIIGGAPVHAGLQCGPFFNGVQQCEAGIDSNLATININQQQHQSEWCWAACISMIFRFYGHPVSQERIVNETWGGIVNLPGQPWQIIRDLNRSWTDDNGDTFSVSGDVFTANAITAAQDLAADHPLVVGSMGHAMVLTNERYVRNALGAGQVQIATVRDPLRGKRPLMPIEWASINFAIRIRVQ